MILQDPVFDLHSHSTASDGILTPSQLVQRAADNKVNFLAITDHDTTQGLAEATSYIKQHKLALLLINGVEISTLWNKLEIHVVGLNIASNDPQLDQLLLLQQQNRIERAFEIDRKLARVSIANAYQHAQNYAQGQSVSRLHFARFLVESGQVNSIQKAFKKYLGKGGYAYVAPNWITIEEAVNSIHQSGGQAVLAHPSRYGLVPNKLKKLICDFKNSGGDGIEVSQSRQTSDDLKRLADYANHFELLASQGSDFHEVVDYMDLGRLQQLPDYVTPIWYNWPNFMN